LRCLATAGQAANAKLLKVYHRDGDGTLKYPFKKRLYEALMPSLAAAQLESHDERTRLRAEAELDAVVENISRLENPEG
jgi:hypothetical protein